MTIDFLLIGSSEHEVRVDEVNMNIGSQDVRNRNSIALEEVAAATSANRHLSVSLS